MTEAQQIFLRAHYSGRKPDPLLTVSEWADKYRVLSQKSSAEPGRWRTERTPYLREIMDCLSPSSPIETVIFMKGAQIGGTECGNNWIGYVMSQAPGPMMAVQPTVDMAKRNSRQRIDPLIQDNPELRALVSDAHSRDGTNSILAKEFPGGILVMTGANSAVGLRSMAARYLFLDEVDGYPIDLDAEGDPINLATARTRTFSRRKIFMVSTPKVKGSSRIEIAYTESDQRKFWVPCPHCKEMQTLEWAGVRWEKDKPFSAVYVCAHCHVDIQNHQKTWMLTNGEWRAQNPGNGRVAGFHLSSLYSPVGWFSWGEAAELFVKAQQSAELLKGFINTILGESWAEQGDAPDWKRIFDRAEHYPLGTVPEGALFLTAGADVQLDRIEVQVVGWGRRRQCWLVDYRILSGDTRRPEVWAELDSVLAEVYANEDGADFPIKKLCLDTGYEAEKAYDWARKHRFGPVALVKGGPDSQTALVATPSAIEISRNGKKLATGLKLHLLNVSEFKKDLYARLSLELPNHQKGETFADGFFHLCHTDDTEEYCRQLTAEQLVTRIHHGYTKREWKKTGRNEAMDTWNYAAAGRILLGAERFSEMQWAQLEAAAARVTRRPQNPQVPVAAQPNRRVRYQMEV